MTTPPSVVDGCAEPSVDSMAVPITNRHDSSYFESFRSHFEVTSDSYKHLTVVNRTRFPVGHQGLPPWHERVQARPREPRASAHRARKPATQVLVCRRSRFGRVISGGVYYFVW